MISQLMMHADAVLIVMIALCCGIVVCEDRDQSFVPKLALVVLAIALCFQAAWLLGIWIPGVAGYPWPRLSVDFALFVLAVWRVLTMLADNRTELRRLSDLSETQRGARLNG